MWRTTAINGAEGVMVNTEYRLIEPYLWLIIILLLEYTEAPAENPPHLFTCITAILL
jgi:hypothetical protein